MHVAIVSDIEVRGGAAIAASRLANCLLDRGVRVSRVVADRSSHAHRWEVRGILPQRNLLYRAIRSKTPRPLWEAASRRLATARLKHVLKELSPDIINVHNLHWAENDGWSPLLVAACSRVAPTVWTLHDMWSFTGGCTYSFDCDSYTSECGRWCLDCEGHEGLSVDSSGRNWAVRKKVLGANPGIRAVTPSMWLANEARKGLWNGHQVEVIANPLDLHVYRPTDRRRARSQLGLPSEGPIILVAAHYLDERRKGLDILLPALERSSPPATVALMGHMGPTALAKMKVHELGEVHDEDKKVLVYGAADFLVHASRAENLSNVIVESLACGTPVVGFDVGGNPELIRPRESGWLSPTITVEGLTVAIEQALTDVSRGIDLRGSSRAVAEELCDSETVTARYIALFESLMQL